MQHTHLLNKLETRQRLRQGTRLRRTQQLTSTLPLRNKTHKNSPRLDWNTGLKNRGKQMKQDNKSKQDNKVKGAWSMRNTCED